MRPATKSRFKRLQVSHEKQMYTVLLGDAVRGATALPFTRWKQSSWTTTGSWAESWRHLRRSYSEFSRVSAVTCSNQRMFCRVDDIWFEFEYLRRKHVEAGWKHRILINAWPFSDAADINRYFAFLKTFFFSISKIPQMNKLRRAARTFREQKK